MPARSGMDGRCRWVARCGTGLMLGGLAWFLAVPLFFRDVLALAARHLSRDQYVTRQGVAFFATILVITGGLIVASGLIMRRLARNDIPHPLHHMFGDERPHRRSYYTFVSSWALGLLTLLWFATECAHAEGGLLETVQFGVLFMAAWILARTAATAGLRTGRGVIHALAAAMAVVAAGEEVSWGQTYFRWRTPEAWATVNVQNETNVHNLFNAWFGPAYQAFALIVLLYFVVSAFVLTTRRNGVTHRWTLLPPNLSGFIFILMVSLLFALTTRCPAWFEIPELCAYLLLFFWGIGNLRRERRAQPTTSADGLTDKLSSA